MCWSNNHITLTKFSSLRTIGFFFQSKVICRTKIVYTGFFYRSEAAITKLEREAKIYEWRAFVEVVEGALANSFV